MPHIGRLEHLGLGKESTKGTGVAATHWLPRVTGVLMPKSEKAVDEGSLGAIDQEFDSQVTKRWSEADLEGVVRDDFIGMLLMAAFGTTAKTGAGPDYTHTFTRKNDNNHPGYSLWGYDSEIGAYRATYAMLDELSMTASPDDYLRFTAKFLAQKEVSQSAPTLSYSDENSFRSKDVNIYLADTEVGLDGATALKLDRLNVSIMKNLMPYWALGSEDVDAIYNQSFIVTGDFDALFDSTTLQGYVFNDTTKRCRIEIINTDIDLGGGVNPSITFTFPKCAFKVWDRNDNNNEIIKQTINFTAQYDATEEYSAQCVLVNGISTAY